MPSGLKTLTSQEEFLSGLKAVPFKPDGYRGFLVQSFGDDGVLEEGFEGNDLKCGLVGGFEDDRAGSSGLDYLQPAGGADAPLVAGVEAGEPVLWHGGGEVVAQASRDGEELFGDDAANSMNAEVVRTGVAAAVTIEAGERVEAAGFQGLAEHVLLRGELRVNGSHGVIVEERQGVEGKE
jgi:hypothetical protein